MVTRFACIAHKLVSSNLGESAGQGVSCKQTVSCTAFKGTTSHTQPDSSKAGNSQTDEVRFGRLLQRLEGT